MKLTGLKWSALPVVVLMAGSVVLAHDQPAPSSQSAPQAQGATPATTPARAAKPKSKPTVTQRKENQQDRIAQAAKRPPSAVRTAFENRQLNGQKSQLERQMYKDNQNAYIASYGDTKQAKRQEIQRDHIAQGIKRGQLAATETAKLENQQKGINRQVKADRAANGWKLTTGEKQKVYKQQANKQQANKQQDVASKSIDNKKHNAKTQPQAKPQQ